MNRTRLALSLMLGTASALGQPIQAQSAAPRGGQPLKYTGPSTSTPVTAGDLMTRLYIFADDSMEGRGNGTWGHYRGTEYIARELARLGLEPAGDDGTFFQAVPLKAVTPEIDLAFGSDAWVLGRDAVMLPGTSVGLPFGGVLPGPETPAVFGGQFGAPDAIAPDAAAGKLVVFLAPTFQGRPTFAIWAEPFAQALAGYLESGAAGLVVAALEYFPQQYLPVVLNPSTVYDDGEPDGGRFAMLITSPAATRLAGKPLTELKVGDSLPTVSGHAGFARRPTEAPSRNVVAIVRGSDPALRDTYVAVGAHSDHVGIASQAQDHDSLRAFNSVVRPRGADDGDKQPTAADQPRIRGLLDSLRALRAGRRDSIMNGADDDGSGSMALLELAEAFAGTTPRPRRSVLFVWHAAEEIGLFGSIHYTDHPTVPRDSIVAQVNVDMIGRGGTTDLPEGGPGYLQLIGSHRLSTELGDLVETVNRSGNHGLRFDYSFDADGHPDQYYCRSDHYSYARYGIPVVFASTGGHRDYHQLTDEPQYLDYGGMARVTLFLQDLVRTVANLDHRPVVDKPKPDPEGECKQ